MPAFVVSLWHQILERYTGEQKIIVPDNVLPTLKRHLKDQEN